MKKIISLVVLVAIVIIGVYFSASPNKKTLDEKTIVAILPLTGSSAVHGEYSKRGIEMALSDLKDSGIKIVYEDSQMDPKVAISALNKNLSEGNASAILALGSPVAMAIAPLSISNKIVLMSVVSAPAYSSLDNYTFRINGTADIEMDNVLNTVKDSGIKKLAVIFQNDDYGKGLLNSLKQKYGKALVAEEGFLPNATDMRSGLTKIKQSQADGVFIAAYAQSVGVIAKQAKDLGLTATLVCGSACDNPDVLKTAGVSAEGLILVAPSSKANSDFATRYKEKYKEEPNFVSIRMYDAVKLIASALITCGNKGDVKVCLKNTIHGVKDFPGVAFPVNFNQSGDLLDQFMIKKVVGGQFKIQ